MNITTWGYKAGDGRHITTWGYQATWSPPEWQPEWNREPVAPRPWPPSRLSHPTGRTVKTPGNWFLR